MKLDPEEHKAIADAVAAILTKPQPAAFNVDEAMIRTGFKSRASFYRFARNNGLRSMRGTSGVYAADSVNKAIGRASR